MQSIFELNPESKSIIRAGEILLIPSTESKDTDNRSRKNYLVKRGETKYGISKAFGISIAQLEQANPIIKSGLQAGHRLNIPESNTMAASTSSLNTSENTTNKEHIVRKGETLWGISQRYNMTLDELRQLNTGRLYEVLQIGQVLLVSTSHESRDTNTYVVKKGDTKYGLSRRFGMSISKLEALNPQISDMLRTGTVLQLDDDEKPVNTDQLAVSSKDINSPLKPTLKPADSSKVTTLVPDQSKDTTDSDKINAAPLNLYVQLPNTTETASQTSLQEELTTGLRRAVREAKTKYPNINFEIKQGTIDSGKAGLNAQNKSYILTSLRDTIIESSINTTTYSLREKTSTSSDSIVIKPIPLESEMTAQMIQFIKSQNGHVICLYEKENLLNVNQIKTAIPNFDAIKINRNGSFKMNDLEKSLKKKVKNYIIIESSRVGVFLTSTSFLLRQSSKYQLQLAVLNYKNIPESSNISYNRFKILNLIYPQYYNSELYKGRDIGTHTAYVVGSDIIDRINRSGLSSFKDGTETSISGFRFHYNFKNNTAQNTAISIYKFDDENTAKLVKSF
jgi:LysM repeat protein